MPAVGAPPLILADVEQHKELQDLVRQARALSERAFANRFYFRDVRGDKHLTLLVDAARKGALGYCYYQLPLEGFLWVEQVAVSEHSRGRGLGRRLMQWAIERAQALGCKAVRVSALASSVPFYRAIGFEDFLLHTSFERYAARAHRDLSCGREEEGWPMHRSLSGVQADRSGDFFYPVEVLGATDEAASEDSC
uniref:N-acetyltransferase domain-containing protein n=1 Tax=Alexandrium catenella TaxID=2925 RepID=A0A7S1MKJ5_ALECA|mmetsp:Transcript_28533/g.77304  ORF Transcript_28533/g.77304 Transcript_28533/m.77304 type:complete len:194 (+) Transcript_28533:72-653(+)